MNAENYTPVGRHTTKNKKLKEIIWRAVSEISVEECLAVCILNKQTHTRLTVCCSLFIAPTCFNANTSSSGSSNAVPAKVHKRHVLYCGLFARRL
jgi:hypothetical protein